MADDHLEGHIGDRGTPDLLSYRTAAGLADCSVTTIRRLVKAGSLTPVYLTPDMPRIPRSELERLGRSDVAGASVQAPAGSGI